MTIEQTLVMNIGRLRDGKRTLVNNCVAAN